MNLNCVRFVVAILMLVAAPDHAFAQLAVAPEAAHGSIEVEHGVVVSAQRDASEVGVDVLQRGGNAVDAAVATAFALAVTHPEAGNIGGGGFMLVFPGDGRAPVCVDYRETAPAAATATTFTPGESRFTCKYVGVPGTVRGLELAHREFGKLSWSELVSPAVKLAEEGFALDKYLANSLNELLKESPDFAELQRVYGKDGGKAEWHEGDQLVLPELGKSLRAIAEHGPSAFYDGEIAEQLVAEMTAGGGLIARDDLRGYQAKLREPIRGVYRGYDIYAAPPPSSGGICLIEMLNILEPLELRKHGRHSAEAMHFTIEAMQRAFCDRARHLGDPDFNTIPADLTDKAYAKKLSEAIPAWQATRSDTLAPEIPLAGEGPNTTHFSVIDASGMAVANTYTLEESYGARIVVRGAGFLLNNEMGDFNPQPGVTTRTGQIGTPANIIAPGKRMLSSMCPLIVAQEGRAVLVTGSPGGRTIINTVLSIVLGVLEYELDVRAAVDAPRWHHQWLPDETIFERSADSAYRAAIQRLKLMGHKTKLSDVQGSAHSIYVDPKSKKRIGAVDLRRTGHAAGY
ncbi:MAG: gamma-glutamyltransferase [Planctomycetia bacterium]|nr:gamma-glutamyltransferase [Planctomycetia bacterium]